MIYFPSRFIFHKLTFDVVVIVVIVVVVVAGLPLLTINEQLNGS